MIMCTFGSISWFFKPGIQASRNPGIPRIWFGFANFNVKISFPTQCLSLNKIFNVSFQDSRIPWIFQELSGTLDSCGNGIFLPSSTYRVIVPLNFRPWTLLSMWHSKIPLFLESSKNYLELQFLWKWPIIHYIRHIWYKFNLMKRLCGLLETSPDFSNLEVPVFGLFYQFQCIGYLSQSVFVLEHDFRYFIPNFQHSWNLPGIILNS